LKLTQVAVNSDAVTHIGSAGDERLFIGDKTGHIRIVEGTSFRAPAFLDLSGRTHTAGEGGLWSVAFSPKYAQSGRFYVAYSRKPDGATVVSRFSVSSSDRNVADSASEEIVLTTAHEPDFHYGGQLAFGPDGFLYVSLGDAQSPDNAQSLGTWHGKILRIDPEGAATGYRVPVDNPFSGQTGALPELWALGLRNPWRFSFDRLTGDLYLGDVGAATREEIDFQPAASHGGENYGWPFWEGNYRAIVAPPSAQFVAPATDYLRGDSYAVIGGFVYRGPNEPRMNGIYVHGDLENGRLWGMKHNGVNWQSELVAKATSGGTFTTFGEDKDGRLYVASWDTIYRLEDSGAVAPPKFDARGSEIFSWLSDRTAVSSRTVGATIRYTTDGRDPTESDPIVPENGMVAVTNGTLLSARAWKTGFTPSEITRALVYLWTAAPRFTPPPGGVPVGTTVTISCDTPDAVIHYTLDGSEPNASAPLYTAPLVLNDSAKLRASLQLKARASRPGFLDGYTEGYYFLPQVATPQLNPSSGPITNGTLVTITCDTPGAIVHFETNNTVPTLDSPVYSGPIPVNGNSWLRAVAFRDGHRESWIATAYYAAAAASTNVATLSFSQSEFQVGEGSRTALITVTRSGSASSAASVDYATATGGSATAGEDYAPTNGTLLFPAGSLSQRFTLQLVPDAIVETNETVVLALSNPTNAILGALTNALLVITNNDFGGIIQFSATNYNVAENKRLAYLLLNRTAGLASNVTVHLLATNGTATAGEDFTALDTNLTFVAGEKKKLVAIALQDDLMDETNETILASLDTPTGGAVLGLRTNATLTLRDNDTAGVIQLSQSTYRVSETNPSVTVLLTRSGGAASHVTVHLQSLDWTASASNDFERVDTIISFGAGERSKAISIAIFNDSTNETTEVARLKLSDATGGAKLGLLTNALLYIVDDEASALGTYIVTASIKSSGCSNVDMNGSVELQGRMDISAQVGSDFAGTATLLGTSGGGYATLSITGSVNAARQIVATYQADAGGTTSTGALTGSLRGEKLQLTLDGGMPGESCRHLGTLTGTRYIALPGSLTPVSLTNRVVNLTVSKASGYFTGLLPYHIDFLTAENCQVISATNQFLPIDGRYVYLQKGPNTATLRIGSNEERTLLYQLTFTSPTNGIFTGTAAGAPGSHAGTFSLGN
jgi:glucose/arabinose dehydrogenase